MKNIEFLIESGFLKLAANPFIFTVIIVVLILIITVIISNKKLIKERYNADKSTAADNDSLSSDDSFN